MLGRNAKEIATADMISRVHDDLHAKYGTHCFKAGDTPKLHSDLADDAAKIAAFLSDKPFMVGEQLTFVDFSIFELLDQMQFLSKSKTFSECPKLGEYFTRME